MVWPQPKVSTQGIQVTVELKTWTAVYYFSTVLYTPIMDPTDRQPRLNIVQTPKLINISPLKEPPPSQRETVCAICGVLLKNKKSLDRHLATKHNIGAKFNCQICGKGFHQKDKYSEHVDSHLKIKKHRCERCNVMFSYRAALKRHLQNNSCVKE